MGGPEPSWQSTQAAHSMRWLPRSGMRHLLGSVVLQMQCEADDEALCDVRQTGGRSGGYRARGGGGGVAWLTNARCAAGSATATARITIRTRPMTAATSARTSGRGTETWRTIRSRFIQIPHVRRNDRLEMIPMSENTYVIWWLDQSAHELAAALGAPSASWPAYIQSEFLSRQGRAGRGRLWIAPEIEFDGIAEWRDGDLAFNAVGRDCGGIVIRRSDAHHVLSWPGFVSDEGLRPLLLRQNCSIASAPQRQQTDPRQQDRPWPLFGPLKTPCLKHKPLDCLPNCEYGMTRFICARDGKGEDPLTAP
jgi:hypothetical protein